jgi:preprotein translocase subunit SecB
MAKTPSKPSKRKSPAKKRVKTQKRKRLHIDQPVMPTDGLGDSPLSHLTLIHVRLVGVQANLDIREGKIPDKATIQAKVGVGQAADDTIHVDAAMNIVGRPSDATDDETSSIVINLHYQCVYRAEGVPADSFRDRAAELATPAMLIMWPHIRELVQSITGRMAIPPLLLPMFVVGSPGKGKGVSVRMEGVNLTDSKD